MERQFIVSDVVWARARKPKIEIFWPAQVRFLDSNLSVIGEIGSFGEYFLSLFIS